MDAAAATEMAADETKKPPTGRVSLNNVPVYDIGTYLTSYGMYIKVYSRSNNIIFITMYPDMHHTGKKIMYNKMLVL